jgi:hypothetical protein
MCRRSRKAVKEWHKPGGAAYVGNGNGFPATNTAAVPLGANREMSESNGIAPAPVTTPSPVHFSYPTPQSGAPGQQWVSPQHTGSVEPGTASTTDFYAQNGPSRNVSPLAGTHTTASPQTENSHPVHTNVPPPQV